jgi:hypothetical protein
LRYAGAMNALRLCLLAALAPLSACGGSEAPAVADSGDPALTEALLVPLAADPDLASQNGANAAASLPSVGGSVPSLDTGPDAASRARSDALALVGGSAGMRQAPEAQADDGRLPAEAALSVAARAALVAGVGGCAGKAEYSAAWAARMPPAFPVYPRGAVQEAAGTDRDGCGLRAVTFRTPVPVSEVIDFYFTLAGRAGFSAQHKLQDGSDVLTGTKGQSSYAAYARQLGPELTEVDLVTSR